MLLAAVCLVVTNSNMPKFGMYLLNEINVLNFSDYNFYSFFFAISYCNLVFIQLKIPGTLVKMPSWGRFSSVF